MSASTPEDPLDRDLREWEAPAPPPDLERRVWRQVGAAGARSSAVGTRLRNFAAGAAWVAAGALSVALVGEWRLHQLEKAQEIQLARDYGRLLAPAGDDSASDGNADVRLERDLGWLQRELKLTPGQYSRLKSLHEDSAGRLQLLAAELAAQGDLPLLQRHPLGLMRPRGLLHCLAAAGFGRH